MPLQRFSILLLSEKKIGGIIEKEKRMFFLFSTYCCSHKPNVFGRGDLNSTWFGHTSNLNIEKGVLCRIILKLIQMAIKIFNGMSSVVG